MLTLRLFACWCRALSCRLKLKSVRTRSVFLCINGGTTLALSGEPF